MEKILYRVMKTIEICITLLLGLEVIAVAMQVIWRYVLRFSLSWTDQMCRFGLQWIVMLGLPLIFYKKEAVAFDIVIGKMTGMPRKILELAICLITVFFAVIFLLCSIDYVRRSGSMEVAGFRWMKYYMLYSSQVVGGAALLWVSLWQSWKALLALREKGEEEGK